MNNNIFQLPTELPNIELFEILLQQPGIKIERIISTGQTTPPQQWYDQPQHEWVILLQGEAEISYVDSSIRLHRGDYLFIPAHQKHRVNYTSFQPPCIWLAVHFSCINS